jgi:hypothetical protein
MPPTKSPTFRESARRVSGATGRRVGRAFSAVTVGSRTKPHRALRTVGAAGTTRSTASSVGQAQEVAVPPDRVDQRRRSSRFDLSA